MTWIVARYHNWVALTDRVRQRGVPVELYRPAVKVMQGGKGCEPINMWIDYCAVFVPESIDLDTVAEILPLRFVGKVSAQVIEHWRDVVRAEQHDTNMQRTAIEFVDKHQGKLARIKYGDFAGWEGVIDCVAGTNSVTLTIGRIRMRVQVENLEVEE